MKFLDRAKQIIIAKMKRKYFEDVCYEWLEHKKEQIKQSTYYNYKFGVEKYLIPYFQGKNIRRIHDFSMFIDELSTSLAPKTIRDIYCIFKMILSYYEEVYGKKLKYKKMILPKIDKKEIEILNSRERAKLENYCTEYNDLRELGILMGLNTGVRLGELCALRWENIDLKEKCIYIRETVQRVYKGKGEKSKVIIDTPKTKCSIRVIPINTKLYGCLKPIRKFYDKNAFFLTGSAVKCVEPRCFQEFFKKTLNKCKIKEHNFHAIRHTFATNCIEVRNGC